MTIVNTVTSTNHFKQQTEMCFNDLEKVNITHGFAAYIQVHFISRGFGGTRLHTNEAMFLLTHTICPVSILQQRCSFKNVFLLRDRISRDMEMYYNVCCLNSVKMYCHRYNHIHYTRYTSVLNLTYTIWPELCGHI